MNLPRISYILITALQGTLRHNVCPTLPTELHDLEGWESFVARLLRNLLFIKHVDKSKPGDIICLDFEKALKFPTKGLYLN